MLWNIFLYLVIPVVLAIWILRRESVQKMLEPLRHKLYARNYRRGAEKHGHSHGHGHEGRNEAKSLLFQDLKTTKSSLKDLKDKGVIRILEIGVGPGTNFKYFPTKCRYIGVDPNTIFRTDVTDNLKLFPGIELEKFLHSGAEDLTGIDDNSVDAVVTTAVLCSVKDLQKSFKEILRVLVPGGKYYYMEHIADDHQSKYLMQKALTFLITLASYTGIIHGAHLDRKIDQEVLKAGFSSVDQKLTRFETQGSHVISVMSLAERHAIGVAVK